MSTSDKAERFYTKTPVAQIFMGTSEEEGGGAILKTVVWRHALSKTDGALMRISRNFIITLAAPVSSQERR